MQQKTLVTMSRYVIALFFAILADTTTLKGYSLLTHEAIIDVSWKDSIEPLLLQKYPMSSPEELITAHAYAYGGAIMPDIGYSPFGSMLYTNLAHNVRSGDYVLALLEEAENINEYAFALGSLAHYTADIYGHSVGTNIAVPLTYAKLKAKFGNVITYADHHKSHSRVELSYDVLQTARGNYVTKAYHDFIGFKVSKSVIERAFLRTYGLKVEDVFKNLPLAISTYRWVVKSLLPNIVRTAWASKKREIRRTDPGITAHHFSYKMKNKDYYQEFGNDLQKAGFIQTVISIIIPVLPKIGPLAKLRFKPPTTETEKLFIKSFDSTLVHYKSHLAKLGARSLSLPNSTLDTGKETRFGQYSIADNSYSDLLFKLEKLNFENVSSDIKDHITEFYASSEPMPMTVRDTKEHALITKALASLNNVSPK